MERYLESSLIIWRMVCSMFPPLGYMSPDPFLAEVVLDEKALRIVREAFVNPHIRRVLHRDMIAEPLMRGIRGR